MSGWTILERRLLDLMVTKRYTIRANWVDFGPVAIRETRKDKEEPEAGIYIDMHGEGDPYIMYNGMVRHSMMECLRLGHGEYNAQREQVFFDALEGIDES